MFKALQDLHLRDLLPLALLGGVLMAHLVFYPYISLDYLYFLNTWLNYMHAHGFGAFATAFYDYNPPYPYLLYIAGVKLGMANMVAVKTIALLFDLLLASGIYLVARDLGRDRKIALYVAVGTLLLPEMFMNSAAWGQVDAGYTGLLVYTVHNLLRRRPLLAGVCYGFAVALKAQALFVLPVLLLALWVITREKRRARQYGRLVQTVLVTAVAFFVWYIPALIAGRPLVSLLTIYVNQTSAYPELNFNTPNPYVLLPPLLPAPWPDILLGVGLVAIGVFVIVCVRWLRGAEPRATTDLRHGIRPDLLLAALTCCAVWVPYVLTHMHERYYYQASVLCVLLGLAVASKTGSALRQIGLPLALLQVSATLTYLNYLLGGVEEQQPFIPGLTYLVYPALILQTGALILLFRLFHRLSRPGATVIATAGKAGA